MDHTHTDALISVTNTAGGLDRVREIFGDRVVFIPYVMPGFKLARLAAELYAKQAGPRTVGLVLMNHGLFTFADTTHLTVEANIEGTVNSESPPNGCTITYEFPAVGDRQALAPLIRQMGKSDDVSAGPAKCWGA